MMQFLITFAPCKTEVMTEPNKNLREQIFIKIPKTIDDTFTLPDLEKVNDLVLKGYRLIRVDQAKLNTGDIGITFSLGKDQPIEHPNTIYVG
jgi:hypothetical protein